MDIMPSFEIGALDLINKFIIGLKKAKEEVYDLFEIGLKDSLINQAEKFYYTNNFIYRENKVPFYDVYFPVTVGYSRKCFESPISDLGEHHCITILGVAGSGKSTLAKYIFLSTIKENRKIPIFIELRNLNSSSLSFENYLYSKILASNVKPNENKIKSTLDKGLFLFILDGYDEITHERVITFVDELGDFVDKNKNNHFVITSRPGTSAENLPRFLNMVVNDLTPNDVKLFIKMQLKSRELINKMLKVVTSEKSKPFRKFLENPLLLSMFIITFEYFPEIPERKSEFYKNVFDTLYSKHDGVNKSSFSRKKRSGLQRVQFENLLSTISYITFFKGKFTFGETEFSELISTIQKINTSFKNIETEDIIYDLITSISILIKDGLFISFPHRSIQEYFAALFIKDLDINKKSKVYKKFLTELLPNSYDTFNNFLDLCAEMDQDSILSFLPIDILTNITENMGEDTYIYEFCEKFSVCAKFQVFDIKAKDPFRVIEIVPDKGYLIRILDYFKCKPCFDWVFQMLNQKLIVNQITTILLKQRRKVLDDLKIKNRDKILLTRIFEYEPNVYQLFKDKLDKGDLLKNLNQPIYEKIKNFDLKISNNNLTIYKLLDL